VCCLRLALAVFVPDVHDIDVCLLRGRPVRAPVSAGVPPVFLPPAKQRSKRARRSSASGTDCDETGQSGGVVPLAAGKLAPRASACLSDVPMSFAGSGGSAFRVRSSSRARSGGVGAAT